MPEETTQDSLLGTEAGNSPEIWYGDGQKELVETKGWKSGSDVVNSYTELEKSMGGRLKMPTPESNAEEIRAFYQKTGCPENPEGYEVSAPEAIAHLRDEGIETAIKQIAFDEGVSKQAFEAIVKGYYDKIGADMIASTEAGERALREQHTDKYDEVVKTADRFFDTCSPEFCQLIKDTGLGRSPVFINEMYTKGQQMISDTLIKGTADGDKPEGDGYVPQYPKSPEQYANGEDEESKKARAWFEARGHKF